MQIKGDKIRDAWPKDEAPTARAITGRIFRLRGGHRMFLLYSLGDLYSDGFDVVLIHRIETLRNRNVLRRIALRRLLHHHESGPAIPPKPLVNATGWRSRLRKLVTSCHRHLRRMFPGLSSEIL